MYASSNFCSAVAGSPPCRAESPSPYSCLATSSFSSSDIVLVSAAGLEGTGAARTVLGAAIAADNTMAREECWIRMMVSRGRPYPNGLTVLAFFCAGFFLRGADRFFFFAGAGVAGAAGATPGSAVPGAAAGSVG